MSKVVRLPTDKSIRQESMSKLLRDLAQEIDEDKYTSLVIALRNQNGDRETAMATTTLEEAQSLVGALDIDLTLWLLQIATEG